MKPTLLMVLIAGMSLLFLAGLYFFLPDSNDFLSGLEGEDKSSAMTSGQVPIPRDKGQGLHAGNEITSILPTASAEPLPRRKITGAVLDSVTTLPVAGALVCLGPDVPPNAVSRTGWISTSMCDPEGKFAFQGQLSGPHRIRASAPGYAGADLRGLLPGEEGEILLTPDPGIPCKLEVNGPGGYKPVPEQELHMEIHGEGWALDATTDHSGFFFITGMDRVRLEQAERDWELRIVVPGFAGAALNTPAETGEEDYLVSVGMGKSLSGLVLDGKTGSPIQGAEVVADSGRFVLSDEEGRYAITGVDETLSARAPGYAMEIRELSDIPGGDEHDVVQVTFRLDAGITLHGHVIDPLNQPVTGIRVGLAPDALFMAVDDPRLSRAMMGECSSITDEKGYYRIAGLPADLLELPGDLPIEVRPPGWLSGMAEEVHVRKAAGETEHDIVLAMSVALSGTVSDSMGRPVTDAFVLLQGMEEDLSQLSATDEQGAFHFLNLPHGPYHVAVLQNDQPVSMETCRIPCPPLELYVENLQEVMGTLVRREPEEPLPDVHVQLVYCQGSMGLDQQTATDDQGRFYFDKVPPGSFWLLFVRGDGKTPLYSSLTGRHRERITVEHGPWSRTIRFRERPSGWARFTFARSGPDSTLLSLEDPVEVWMSSYRYPGKARAAEENPGLGLPGWNSEQGSEILLGRGTGALELYLREGKYELRFHSPSGDRDLAGQKSVIVTRDDIAEHQIIFEERTVE